MVDFNEPKIEIYTGINDVPVPPTAIKAGNGSHLISLYNNLVDAIRFEFLNVDGLINGIRNNDIPDIQQTFLDNYNNISSTVDDLRYLTNAAYPTNFTHWHDSSIPVTGGQLQTYNFADQPYSTVSQKEPPNLLDEFKFSVPLNPGIYQMTIIARSSQDGGICTLKITTNTIPIDPIDLFSAVPAPMVIVIPFNINFTGMHTFSIKATGTSQTGYAIPITKFSIVQPIE